MKLWRNIKNSFNRVQIFRSQGHIVAIYDPRRDAIDKTTTTTTNPQSPFVSGTTSPVPCGPPEYFIAPYKPGEYEFVGVPLEPSSADDESSGPSTAEIIASQSQDYVDEKLAEYQATIQLLQGE